MRNVIFLLLTTMPIISCVSAGNSYSDVEKRISNLEQQNTLLNKEIKLVRECENYRKHYSVEKNNCLYGLDKNTLAELQEMENDISQNVVEMRVKNACIFACKFEIKCKFTTRQSCEE